MTLLAKYLGDAHRCSSALVGFPTKYGGRVRSAIYSARLKVLIALTITVIAIPNDKILALESIEKQFNLKEGAPAPPHELEDIVMGSHKAPHTIVEYASMTCGACADFHNNVLPQITEKYIRAGEVKFILREFPLDATAAAASLVARCAGEDKYSAVVDALFASQRAWRASKKDARTWLYAAARSAGLSRREYNQCLADDELFDKIVKAARIARTRLGINSTPTFFINGSRVVGKINLGDLEVMFAAEP